MIKLCRVPFNDEHMDQKFLVLEASLEGMPQLTKRVTINTASLADGSILLSAAKAKLIADVTEYHARWLAVQQALTEL